jgi:beta-lactamase superfamily II metal-dependent hydrolase
MATIVHFIDVGEGNMTLVEAADGRALLCDCNITDENADRVLTYLELVLAGRPIAAFLNSHRDADHMRGIRRLHDVCRIEAVLDCGVQGTTTDTAEYREYMQVRSEVMRATVLVGRSYRMGQTSLRFLGGQIPGTSDANAQSAIVKVEDGELSVVLAGDSDATAWKRICSSFPQQVLRCTALLASHHGSMTFFEERQPRRLSATAMARSALPLELPLRATRRVSPPPSPAPPPGRVLPQLTRPPAVLPTGQPGGLAGLAPRPHISRVGTSSPPVAPAPRSLFLAHLACLAPMVTVVSVGPNVHGHPDPRAVELYELFTGDAPVPDLPKTFRTDRHGTLRLELNQAGGWRIETTGW